MTQVKLGSTSAEMAKVLADLLAADLEVTEVAFRGGAWYATVTGHGGVI